MCARQPLGQRSRPGKASVAFPRLLHFPPSLHAGCHRKQQQPFSAAPGLGQCAPDKWAFCPQLHRGQALPNLQAFCFLLLSFFFSLAKSIYRLIFPPCKLISYSAPASIRKHPLSQGGLETPSLAVITLSSLTASHPAYKTFPFSPARGCPASQKKRKYSKISSPPRPS